MQESKGRYEQSELPVDFSDTRPISDKTFDKDYHSDFDFGKIMREQHRLQDAYGIDIEVKGKERCSVIKDLAFSMFSELNEMMECVSWRDWSESDVIDENGVKEELRDVFQFFVNIMLVIHMTPSELETRTFRKQAKNWKRLESSYHEHINTKDSDGSEY